MTKQKAANLGQLYGLASAIRILAEEASAMSILCFEQKHTDFLSSIAKQADTMCCEVMTEFDNMKEPIDPWKLHHQLMDLVTKEQDTNG